MKLRLLLAFALLALLHPAAIAQPVGSPQAINKLIDEEKIKEASALLHSEVNRFIQQKNTDTLPAFIYATARIALAQKGLDAAVKETQSFLQRLKAMNPSKSAVRKTLDEAGFFYGENGRDKLAYDTYLEELHLIEKMPGDNIIPRGKMHSNLGAYADRMGDIDLSLMHNREALRLKLSTPKPDYELLYGSYNNLGASMWYASKTDSAIYYFGKALEMLRKMKPNIDNQFYRPAVVNNNMSAIYSQQGNTTAAIAAMKLTINNLKLFLASKEESIKKKGAVAFQFQAIDNLAGIYKDLGDYQQALSLLQYSYGQKQQQLAKDNAELFKSEILIGQLLYETADYHRSESLLLSGLKKIEQSGDEYLYWQGDASKTLASIYDKRNNFQTASRYYNQADSFYAASLNGSYDDIYLELLRKEAFFYAKHGFNTKAIAIATKAYKYVSANQKKPTLVGFYHLLNLGQVYYRTGNYKQALLYSNKGLALANTMIKSSASLLDSVKTELGKPDALLLRAKASYLLSAKHDTVFLAGLLSELTGAMDVLERQKMILQNPEGGGILLANYSELIEFIKEITLELYFKTGNKKYIGQVMGLHESVLYSRIRSRIDQMQAVQFLHVPPAIITQEQQLQKAITESLQGTGSHQTNAYFAATEAWQQFQSTLRQKHPAYYDLRYGSTFRSLDAYQSNIPAGSTLVRYFFVGDGRLYALVADAGKATMVSISTDDLKERLTQLGNHRLPLTEEADLLQRLYSQLWAPIAKNIGTRKVIIIPDGALYSLNFELLTKEKMDHYSELATKGLLATHAVSYHYSLLVATSPKKATLPAKDFTGFAPGFSDALRDNYTKTTKDSVVRDDVYQHLLPQPFTVSLAEQTQKMLGGNLWLNEASTEASFKQHAGNHKIIHIGTHAESNNNQPQYSRLIFAPDDNAKEDNSLFLSEIYNCNLNANLAVLTACESGKAGYSNGEGMVSLAHAFNYAGSESILTGLWKIDEQSSAMIMELFYKNLIAGKDKDEALRDAKLSYLATCEPRMRAPQYWAGLVIMGDVSAISLQQKQSGLPLLVVSALVCIGIASAIVLLRRRKQQVAKYA